MKKKTRIIKKSEDVVKAFGDTFVTGDQAVYQGKDIIISCPGNISIHKDTGALHFHQALIKIIDMEPYIYNPKVNTWEKIFLK